MFVIFLIESSSKYMPRLKLFISLNTYRGSNNKDFNELFVILSFFFLICVEEKSIARLFTWTFTLKQSTTFKDNTADS